MSRIQIADLQTNGTELFQGTESFLTELQSVEASAIYGGKCAGGKKKTGGSKIGKSPKKNSGKNSGKSSGGSCPAPAPSPLPGPGPAPIGGGAP
jgi:hypothetical protein